MARKKKTRKSKKDVVLKIPHIGYTVVVRHKQKGDLDDAGGYTKYMYSAESEICLPLPITGPKRASILTHEIVHVLQNICSGSNMDFLKEREHMAYIAGWLFDEISKI